ncbi:P-loop containing nucleoside triphosphate hydrolase protein, partial [Mycena latifolia]
LPSEPKRFHGRESDVSAIIQAFGQETPRIAILGGGGMGKTSLARAILHHPTISGKYHQHRFFVACDAASTIVQLAALIAVHVGLKPAEDLTEPVIRHFLKQPPCLLVLDNLETVWEPRETRGDVEKFLALLTDISHLALIITMRGAERPANVKWTHPFLHPLKPLTQDAARRTFIDIVDDGCSAEDVDKILSVTDNMPLAIDIIAHLVDYEGLASVMHRWETERISLLSEGYNKGSNLELSISLSMQGPRLASMPDSRHLLSLLSMLPDGLSDVELLQSKIPIGNILACKATLLHTSLAYADDQKRLKALVPIREYMQKMHPAMTHHIQPLLKHFHKLLNIHETYRGTTSSPGIEDRIGLNIANIQSILRNGLNKQNPDLVNIIYCTCQFDSFMRTSGHGQTQLIYEISSVLPHPRDHRLEVYFIMTLLAGHIYHPVPNDQHLVEQALEYITYFDDPDLKC